MKLQCSQGCFYKEKKWMGRLPPNPRLIPIQGYVEGRRWTINEKEHVLILLKSEEERVLILLQSEVTM